MTFLRSLLFNLLATVWTVTLLLCALPFLVMDGFWSNRLGCWWSRGLLGLLRTVCRLSYEVRGTENIPPGPVLIAAKHQSMWDTILLPVVFDRPCFILKRELLHIPLFGWYLARSGMVAVDRSGGAKALKDMVAQARKALADERPLVIFPEGTRVAPGDDAPYHPGVAALYAQLDVPVVPVALNSGLFWSRRAFFKRPGMVTVEFLAPIPPGLPRRSFMTRLKAEIDNRTRALVAAAKLAA